MRKSSKEDDGKGSLANSQHSFPIFSKWCRLITSIAFPSRETSQASGRADTQGRQALSFDPHSREAPPQGFCDTSSDPFSYSKHETCRRYWPSQSPVEHHTTKIPQPCVPSSVQVLMPFSICDRHSNNHSSHRPQLSPIHLLHNSKPITSSSQTPNPASARRFDDLSFRRAVRSETSF